MKFKITYDDPETGEEKVVFKYFLASGSFSPKDWADDYSYMMADKGPHKVEEIKE